MGLGEDMAAAMAEQNAGEKPAGDQPIINQNNNESARPGADVIILPDQEKSNENAANNAGSDDFETKFSERFKLDSKTAEERISSWEGLKAKAEAVPYQTPIGKAFDELTAKGVPEDVALKYIKADESKMSDLEFATFQLQLKHNITEAEAKRKVERDFKIGEFKDSDESEADGLLDLKIKVGQERPEFSKLKEQMLAPFTNRASVEQEQKAGQRVKAWEAEVPKVLGEAQDLKLDVGVSDKGKPLFQIPFKVEDPKIIAQLAQDAKTLVDGNPWLENTAEGRETLKTMLKNQAIVYNLPNILHKAVKLGKTDVLEKIGQQVAPVDLDPTKTIEFQQQTADRDQQIYDTINRAHGGK